MIKLYSHNQSAKGPKLKRLLSLDTWLISSYMGVNELFWWLVVMLSFYLLCCGATIAKLFDKKTAHFRQNLYILYVSLYSPTGLTNKVISIYNWFFKFLSRTILNNTYTIDTVFLCFSCRKFWIFVAIMCPWCNENLNTIQSPEGINAH